MVDGVPVRYGPQRIMRVYVVTNALFTLAASLIWAINTLFLIRAGGMSLALVFVINAGFTASQAVCEVPTGVIADTLGRKLSFLLSIGTLIVSTLIYVLSAQLHWGFWGFMVGSVLIGLGFTFQTGAVDAWMVDALDATGYEGPKERVFALSGEVSGIVLVVGPLLGGLLGGFSLLLPYYLRTAALVGAFVAVAVMMEEVGFTPRPLTLGSFWTETRAIASAGTAAGWRSRTVRPLLWISALQGLFMMYGFYSLSPWLLELLGKNYVWLTGAVFSVFSLAGIAGNMAVRRSVKMRGDRPGPDPARVLATLGAISAVLVVVAGVCGVWAAGGAAGYLPFFAVAGLWVVFGFIMGMAGPMASTYINAHIPSAQRATVLSLSSLFGDVGGVAGQPVLGYAAQGFGIAPTWVVGGLLLLGVAPLYRASGRAAARAAVEGPGASSGPPAAGSAAG
ncbi:MAG TPA: MFS transporter [Coriobacteriia bacterium]